MGTRSRTQAARWLSILERLSASKRGLTAGELAAEFGCAPRTIYRDLAMIESQLGIPLIEEKENEAAVTEAGRWRMLDGYRYRANLEITPEELLAVLASVSLAGPLLRTPYASGLRSLAAKLKGRLPAPTAAMVQADGDAFVAGTTAQADPSARVLETLRRAIRERSVVEMRYFSMSSRAESVRKVEPLHVWHAQERTYLIGMCHVHRTVRTFAVDRVRSAERTAETFERPRGFRVRDYIADAFAVCRGEPQRVVIHFSHAAAPLIRERTWHATQSLVELPSGEVGLAMRTGGLDEVARWVLGFGGEARVVEPPELARTVARAAAAARDRYGVAGARSATAEAVLHRRGRR